MSENAMTVGEALRAAREGAGYSVAEISEITRIRKDVITDLESNIFTTSGGMAYARGHIRSIAKTIKADGDYLVQLLEETTGEVDRPMIDLLTENNATPVRRELPKVSYKTMASAAAGVIALLILVPSVSGLFTSSTHVAKKSVHASVSQSTSSDAVATVATKTSDVSITITGTAGKSWVGITDASGAQVFSGQIAQGASQSFSDAQQLYVVIGNAGAVDVVANGKDLGTPGAIGEVAHLAFGPGSSSQG